MTDSQLVEQIVQEVIRRLQQLGASTAAVSAANSRRDADSVSGAGNVLKLEDRVITLQTIAGRLDGVTQVEMPARAVITPSAIDELNDRKITLTKHI